MAPPDSILLTIEMTCDESEPLEQRTADDLRRQLKAEIGAAHGLPESAFIPMELRRTRFGYPMYDLERDAGRRP